MEQRLRELGIEPLFPDQEPVTPDYVESLEIRLGTGLPPEYRHFLLQHGTCASTHELNYQVGAAWLGGADIFFGRDASGAYDVMEHWDAYEGRVPRDLLPIATDPGGDLLCLGVRGEHRGKVFFWDEDNEKPGGEPWWKNVYEVAPSLREFFDRLVVGPDV